MSFTVGSENTTMQPAERGLFPTPEGMNSIGDDLHLDTPSLRAFAKGYADAYFQITTTKP